MANGEMKKRLENFDLFQQPEVELKEELEADTKDAVEDEELHKELRMPAGIPQQYVMKKEEEVPKKKKSRSSMFAILTFIIGVASLMLSALSIFSSVVAMYTIPVSIFGIINAKKGMQSNGTKPLAIIGLICTILALVVSVAVLGVTVYFLVTGMI